MKLFVTGGAGFIGSNFIRYILENHPEDSVINYDKLTYAGNLGNLQDLENDPRYSFVKGDILNQELVEYCIKGADAIVHFAAETHVDRSISDPSAFIKTNVLGTYCLLEAAKNVGIKRFHHVSTDEVFGSLPLEEIKMKFSENTAYDPRSPYSASKAGSDHLVRSYYHTFKLPITISNCSNNYGPYQYPEKVIPLFVTNLLAGKKVPLYGDGRNVRDWIYVEDHCAGIDAVLRKGIIGETYCFGGDSERSNYELTMAILQNLGFGEEMIEYVADRKGHDRRYAINSNKAKAELGWRPTVSFEERIRRTVQWYAKNEEWVNKIKLGTRL